MWVVIIFSKCYYVTMQSQTSDNSGFNKLKTILFLGLSCNYTTLLGSIVTFVLLQHLKIEEEFFIAIIKTVCIIPFFMGDAVNCYVLGRIRLEAKNDWDDIRMTPQSKERIAEYFSFYRAVSILSSYSLAALSVMTLGKYNIPEWFIAVAIAVPVIHFAICFMNILTGIAPVIPSYKKRGIIHRVVFAIIFGGCWYYIYKENGSELGSMFILVSGMLYFVANGLMTPMPTNGSLLTSILKDTLLNQKQSAGDDPALGYTNKPVDIEDASIISNNNIENVSRETESVPTPETNDSVFPDTIIVTPQETSDEQ